MTDQDSVETNPALATGLAAVALLGVLGALLPPGLVARLVESTGEPAPGGTASAVEQAPAVPASEAAAVPRQAAQAPGKPAANLVQAAPDTADAVPATKPEVAAPGAPAMPGRSSPAPVYRPAEAWYSQPHEAAQPAQSPWGGYSVPGYQTQTYSAPTYPAPYGPYYGQPYPGR